MLYAAIITSQPGRWRLSGGVPSLNTPGSLRTQGGHGTAHYGQETRSDDTAQCHETSDDDDDDCHHCVSGSFSAVRV